MSESLVNFYIYIYIYIYILVRATWEFSKGVNNQYLLAELWPSVSVT